LSLDLASGLCFLHRHLVAHLDLKPDNLVPATDHPDSLMFFATQPVLKIIDFNLAARVAREDELLTLFQGTEGYMAPEVCGGEPFLPFKGDLFSCGRM
ncbi:kinase-like domain-containing protein, partial [Rhodocollybia butyracea]